MKNRKMLLTVLSAMLVLPGWSSPLSATSKVIMETVEQGAKKSGKMLTPAAKRAAEKALREATVHYGDDAIRLTRVGGLEILEQGAKHGKPFWEACAHATPTAVRSLALHADDLMPLYKRIGTEFLTLESKVPGLGKKAVEIFGDQSVRTLTKIPEQDLTRLIGFAQRADTPATAQKLLECYGKTSGKILDHLDWKHIVSAGLSTATVVGAYQVTKGIQEGLKDPKTAQAVVDSMSSPFRYALYVLFAFLLIPVGIRSIRWSIAAWKKRNA